MPQLLDSIRLKLINWLTTIRPIEQLFIANLPTSKTPSIIKHTFVIVLGLYWVIRLILNKIVDDYFLTLILQLIQLITNECDTLTEFWNIQGLFIDFLELAGLKIKR